MNSAAEVFLEQYRVTSTSIGRVPGNGSKEVARSLPESNEIRKTIYEKPNCRYADVNLVVQFLADNIPDSPQITLIQAQWKEFIHY